jgi:hypothetical protein
LKFRFICCDVFFRQACLACARTTNTIDVEFIRLGLHESPDGLRAKLQQRIDEADLERKYDAVLLGYGLCGNGTAGLRARSMPLVMPRAHDCCTIFLGKRERFVEAFGGNPSAEWSCAGYMEKGGDYPPEADTGRLLEPDRDFDKLVKEYGDENARYVWDMLHPANNGDELTYIEFSGSEPTGFLSRFKSFAEKKGSSLRVLEGSMRLLDGLLGGEWDGEDYLVVPPGREIRGVYDQDNIICFE